MIGAPTQHGSSVRAENGGIQNALSQQAAAGLTSVDIQQHQSLNTCRKDKASVGAKDCIKDHHAIIVKETVKHLACLDVPDHHTVVDGGENGAVVSAEYGAECMCAGCETVKNIPCLDVP